MKSSLAFNTRRTVVVEKLGPDKFKVSACNLPVVQFTLEQLVDFYDTLTYSEDAVRLALQVKALGKQDEVIPILEEVLNGQF
jgi:hypothetical protein